MTQVIEVVHILLSANVIIEKLVKQPRHDVVTVLA